MKARRAGQSALLLLDVVELLAKHEVPCVVVGAMAAAVHGSIRATTDADALMSIALPGLAKIQKAFEKSGFKTDLRHGEEDDPIAAVLVVSDTHGNRVDLLAGLRGLDPEAFARAISVPFKGRSLRVVSREDFIAMKCFAGEPQDLADARSALALATEPVDVDLLRRLARRFGRPAADVLESLLGAKSLASS